MSPRLLPTTSIHHDKQDPTICGSNTEQRCIHSTSHTTSQLQQNSYLSLLYSLPITTTWTLYLLPHSSIFSITLNDNNTTTHTPTTNTTQKTHLFPKILLSLNQYSFLNSLHCNMELYQRTHKNVCTHQILMICKYGHLHK